MRIVFKSVLIDLELMLTCKCGQSRSQGISLEGGRGGKRPWHWLVTCTNTERFDEGQTPLVSSVAVFRGFHATLSASTSFPGPWEQGTLCVTSQKNSARETTTPRDRVTPVYTGDVTTQGYRQALER